MPASMYITHMYRIMMDLFSKHTDSISCKEDCPQGFTAMWEGLTAMWEHGVPLPEGLP